MHALMRRVSLAAASTMACLLLLSLGCEEDNPVDEGGISETNLLPIAQGRLWVYTTYLVDTTGSQKVPGTDHREVSYVQGTVTLGGKSAFRMIDSNYTPAGILENVDTSYVALEGGDLWMWHDDMPTPAWGPIFKLSAGVNNEYTVKQWQEVRGGVPISAASTGKIYPKESVSVPAGTIEAYRIELKASVIYGGLSVDQVTHCFYLADGYGPVRTSMPVQIHLGSGQKIEGKESLLVSKNF